MTSIGNRPGYYQRVNARLQARRIQKAFEQGFLFGLFLGAGIILAALAVMHGLS